MSDNTFNSIYDRMDWHDDTKLVAIQTRLRQRARQYAAPAKERGITPEDAETLLIFQLGEEQYGINVMSVRSVRPLTKITRVPGTPSFYRGVVNIRGKITTVLDLRQFFDMSVSDAQPPDELIIVESNQLMMGLLVHHVTGVVALPRSAIEMSGESRYTLGVTSDRLVVLNIQQIFESERLILGGTDEQVNR
jgi:purine-binding chemotaxis protein CheW